MIRTQFGKLGEVSRLTLGGGGIGQIWGENSRDEALATLTAAVDAGIDLIDCAPLYRNCQAIIGEAFAGHAPSHLRFTTKCYLGSPPAENVSSVLRASLEASLEAMRLPQIDIFFLHTNLCPDAYVYEHGSAHQSQFATTWSLYAEHVVPTFEALEREGRIRAWGITGVGIPDSIHRALDTARGPAFVQAITNLLDSPGGLRRYAEEPEPREIIRSANRAGVPVMGIRVVQAGALTLAIDRELPPDNLDRRDHARAAPFRALCAEMGEDPALIAHRYALSMEGVATIVLGVKNRRELSQCLRAEEEGPLPQDLLARIDALGLREAV